MGCHPPSAGPQRRVTLTWFSVRAISGFARAPDAAWMSKGYFDSIPKELDEAGLVDGASRLQIFLRIIMPIAVPGTVATLLFGFLLAWQDLLWALCLISPTIILYLFLQRFYVEGLARGAVKG